MPSDTSFFISILMHKILLGTLYGYEIYPEDNKLMNTYKTEKCRVMILHLCHIESRSNDFPVL